MLSSTPTSVEILVFGGRTHDTYVVISATTRLILSELLLLDGVFAVVGVFVVDGVFIVDGVFAADGCCDWMESLL